MRPETLSLENKRHDISVTKQQFNSFIKDTVKIFKVRHTLLFCCCYCMYSNASCNIPQ